MTALLGNWGRDPKPARRAGVEGIIGRRFGIPALRTNLPCVAKSQRVKEASGGARRRTISALAR
jgi:hypothetical protein